MSTDPREQLEKEVGSAEQWLNDIIGVDEYRAYIYPCTEIRENDITVDGKPISKKFRDMYLEDVKSNCIF